VQLCGQSTPVIAESSAPLSVGLIHLPAATFYHADGDGKTDEYRVFLYVTPIYV
jgi:hypothetical protein